MTVDIIPKEYKIGRKYHCSWSTNRGYVWVLRSYSIKFDRAVLETPRTKKTLITQLSALRDINKNIIK